jgi:hypothetical protein
MRRACAGLAFACVLAALSPPASLLAQSLACRGLYADRSVTISFLRKSAEVSRTLFSGVVRHHHAADDLVARAVLAEFDRRPDPALCRAALQEYAEASAGLRELEKQLGELMAIHRGGRPLPLFEEAVGRLLRERGALPAIALRGQRYSNVAGSESAEATKAPQTLLDVLRVQQEGVGVLAGQIDDTVEALRAVIPWGEKGELTSVVLSGRSAFGDKAKESVELLGRFTALYTNSCGATIAATVHVYPAGLEWLSQPSRPPPSPPGP